MKRTLTLALWMITVTTNTLAATPEQKPTPKPQNQIRIIFADNEVPSFIVIENKGKKRIVIDRHGKTLLDDKAL